MSPLYETNIAILKEALAGKSYQECAKQFQISVANVSQYIRTFLDALREHTDIDIISSASYAYIHEKKKEIKKYLKAPIPKVSITKAAKAYLNQKFGKYYAKDPAKVAATWSDATKVFTSFRDRRNLLSIQNWLASEGYMVGDVITDAMLDFAWATLRSSLEPVNLEEGQNTFVVKKIERSSWQKKLIVHAEIGQDQHKATRKFAIELVPDYF